MELKGLEALLRDSGLECSPQNVRQMFACFDSSEALTRDGTLFVDDFERLFKHGESPAARVPLDVAHLSCNEENVFFIL
eukprot:scaffold312178_cov37-Prasinocladus_malaysianus.AAC.1